MRQSITVKYLGPTNSRGSRWKATCAAGSIYMPQEYAEGPAANASMAARTLVIKMRWHGNYQGGQDHKGDYHFVHLDDGFQQTRVTGNAYKEGYFYVGRPELK